MITLLEKLENQMSLPGDTDTRRKQKVAALLAGVAGMLLAFFTAAVHAYGGSETAVWLHIGLGLYMFLPIIWLLLRPKDYFFWVLLTALVVTTHPWIVSFVTGGFRSGFFPMFWTMFGPFSSILLIGLWPAGLCTAVMVAAATVSTLLDPLAASMAPPISEEVRLFLGLFNLVMLSAMIFVPTIYLFHEQEQARAQIDRLLLNILPAPIASRLKQGPTTIADSYTEVTVLFADIVDFTQLSAGADPGAVVGLLNQIFSRFDDLADQYGLEKIKTIGDEYMVAGGLPLPREDHCEAVTEFGLAMLAAIRPYRAWNGEEICLRVGIHSGPVVAGVIGHRKFSYDLWGDTVNTASRMEASGVESMIQVTATVKEQLDGRYQFEERPPIFVKGKGLMTTYLLRPPNAA